MKLNTLNEVMNYMQKHHGFILLTGEDRDVFMDEEDCTDVVLVHHTYNNEDCKYKGLTITADDLWLDDENDPIPFLFFSWYIIDRVGDKLSELTVLLYDTDILDKFIEMYPMLQQYYNKYIS